MNDLVFLEKKMALCDSRLMAEKFTKGKHAYVVDVIESIILKIDKNKGRQNRPLKSEPVFIEKENEYRGQKFKYYLLNRTAFMLVVMRFRTEEAFYFQLEFIDAFNRMEDALSNKSNASWIESRENGKVARKQETDAIKEFVEYAKSQGSNHADYYYKHFTTATYKALELIQHDKPKLRDTLNMLELNQLFIAESIAEKIISKGMTEGEHYKFIFSMAKEAIEKYASTLLLTYKQERKIKEV